MIVLNVASSKSISARLRDDLGISFEQLMGLGRVEPQNKSETFCMTVIGLKLSRKANGVSQLHGHVSRRMWSGLWPWRVEEEIPIGHITNGVHIPSWLSVQMRRLFDRYFPKDWMAHMGEPDVWQGIYKVDPGELWETHNLLKNQLLHFVRRRIAANCRRREEAGRAIETARQVLNPAALTIGFARRFATYKRAQLLFQDLDRIERIVYFRQHGDELRPVSRSFCRSRGQSGKQRSCRSTAGIRLIDGGPKQLRPGARVVQHAGEHREISGAASCHPFGRFH